MRILLLNQVFFPDVAATAQHAHDLGRHLVAHGHEVVVIASRAIYGERGATLPRRETIDGIVVHRVGVSLFGKAGVVARLIDFALFYVAAAIKALTIRRCDVAVCFTTPPFIASVGWLLRLIRRTRYVYWAMDLYPDVLIAGGMLKQRSLTARILERANRFCMKRAERVVVLGRCMQKRVSAKGIAPERIATINVWSDGDEVRPIAPTDNSYRTQWSAGDKFLIMYSGNFGLVHDMETMCAAARDLAHDQRTAYAFVGGGKRKRDVERFVQQHQLANVHIEPYQPREKLDELLSAADLHLISLRNGYEGIVVPSKLYGIMSAGRPAIFIGPKESEVAMALAEHDCGVTVSPGDHAALVTAIRKLAADRERAAQMGARGRAALRDHYDRRRACEAWRHLLERIANPLAEPIPSAIALPGRNSNAESVMKANQS